MVKNWSLNPHKSWACDFLFWFCLSTVFGNLLNMNFFWTLSFYFGSFYFRIWLFVLTLVDTISCSEMMDPLPSKGRLIGSGALSRFTAQHKELVRRRHSLAPETVEKPPNDHIFTRNRRSFVFSSTGNAGNSPIVAIDSKIEQAMVSIDWIKSCFKTRFRKSIRTFKNMLKNHFENAQRPCSVK